MGKLKTAFEQNHLWQHGHVIVENTFFFLITFLEIMFFEKSQKNSLFIYYLVYLFFVRIHFFKFIFQIPISSF